MEKAKMQLKSVLDNERGQGLVEYVLAITSISLVALLNVKWIGTWLVSAMGNATAAL